MPYYQAQLALTAPLSTPLHSGTFFGHLCWAYFHLHSEEALSRWLAALPDDPFLLSSPTPSGFLPVPLLPPPPLPPNAGPESVLLRKTARKKSFLPVQDFLTLRAGLSPGRLYHALAASQTQPPALASRRAPHNTINRLTLRTLDRGGLYFADESWPGPASLHWDLYLSTSLPAAELQALLAWTGRHGYGRDASLGRGSFTATVRPAPHELFSHSGNRLLSLSHGALSPNMAAARYRLAPHYGKLGAAAPAPTPFKFPLLLLRPGANFLPSAPPFGALFSGVAPSFPSALHNAWHFTIPFTESED